MDDPETFVLYRCTTAVHAMYYSYVTAVERKPAR